MFRGNLDRRYGIAAGLWITLWVASSARVLITPTRHHFHHFANAASGWWQGISLYGHDGGLYRYSPTFAVLVSPFAVLESRVGNILWNGITLAVLFYAVQQLTRWVLPGPWTARTRALLMILVFPAVIRGVGSSQSHGFSATCLFLGLVALSRRRWWLAGLLLAIPFYIKLAPLVLGLLLGFLLARKFLVPYAASMLALALLPFATQRPGFVLAEYGRWMAHLAESSGQRSIGAFRDVWHLWELSGIPFNLTVYRSLQVLAGLAVVAFCWHLRSRLANREFLTLTFAVGVGYMLLFGPAVEFNQYVLIAPFLGWAILQHRDRALLAIYPAMLVFGFGRVERALFDLTGLKIAMAIAPLGTICFVVWIVVRARRLLLENDELSHSEVG